MAQPGQQVPPRAFSPAQHQQVQNQAAASHSPSPGGQKPGFALPSLPTGAVQNTGRAPSVNYGATVSNPQSQPASPYSAASPRYPQSPNVSTPTGTPSPAYASLQPAPSPQPQPQTQASQPMQYQQQQPNQPQHNYSTATATANGTSASNAQAGYRRPNHIQLNNTANASMGAPLTPTTPAAPGTPGLQQQQQQQPQPVQQHYTQQAFAPPAPSMPATPNNVMGPPTGKPHREYEYDVTDSLAGTGVDIRAEENALADYYAGSFGPDARTGLPANAPGDRASFYGAGFANQPGVATSVSQKEFEAAEAERAYNESAVRLANARATEHNAPFLEYANVHARMEEICQKYGLELNLDNKNNAHNAHVQKTKNPAEYPPPQLSVTTKTGPDGSLVTVNGSLLPTDSFLIDQLALLSLATKERVRTLLQDSHRLSIHRQQTSHGVIPLAWAEEGIALESMGLSHTTDAGMENGNGSKENSETNGANGVAGNVNSRKRGMQAMNPLSQTLRDFAYADRRQEEERLRKRQKRVQDEAAAQNGSRAGSATPGTPGSVAPEPEKQPSKKEQKKIAAQKHDTSAESINTTMRKFLGGGKKKYSWLSGGAASTARTPARGPGATGTAGSGAGSQKAPENTNLTPEPRNKMGSWRESSEKGKKIQLRDWTAALERDGRDQLALQKAYRKWKRET